MLCLISFWPSCSNADVPPAAPNSLTERGYTKAHLENVKDIISSINETIRFCILNSRSLGLFDDVMWNSISEYGSIAALNAKEIGLVDSLPSVSPLSFMTNANKSTKAKEELEAKFGLQISSNNFSAMDTVSVVQYKRMLDKRAKLELIQMKTNNMLHRLSELSTATSMFLSGFGIRPKKTSVDKIAVVTIDGGIDRSLSFRVIQSLQQIRNDKHVKCIVLRVNSGGGSVISSEAILEELKTLHIVSEDSVLDL